MAWTDVRSLRFEELEKRLQNRADYGFLRRQHIRPYASRFHFDVAKTILATANVPVETAWPVLEAVLLLEQGLSIHDAVDEPAELKRQLFVLAGDLYSSHYYWILAELDDERLLDRLCAAVVQINEAKAACARLPADAPPEAYIELQEVIQGSLLFALADHFLPDADWAPQIRSLVRGYVVQKETAGRRPPVHFTLRQAYDWLSDATDRVLRVHSNVTGAQPLSAYVVEYLSPILSALERQSLVEGNRG
ncbi:MAG: heptaprenyl diphosphate synthase component 1 [Alicyclobacillus sp.]|nr:heptaprenyl diphosphate synthase component 1 [Alicyclobacillus sp.]